MSKNPLIQDLIANEAFPSVSIALPTGGRWYTKGVLEKDTDPLDVPVGVLGVLAEQNYRDPWLVLSGESLPRMLKSVCPAIHEPNELCEVDLEAILLASRLVSYGPILELKYGCSGPVAPNEVTKTETEKEENKKDEEKKSTTCDHLNVINLDVNEHIMRYAPLEDDDVTDYILFIERINQTVYLRPMSYFSVIQLIKDGVSRDRQIENMNEYTLDDLVVNPESIRKYTEIVDMSTTSSLDAIASSIFCVESAKGERVNGDEFIKEWLLALPAVEVERITKLSNELAVKMRKRAEITFECSKCGWVNSIMLELDANRLFGPAGASQQPKKPSPKSRRGGKKKKTSSRTLRP